MRFGVKMKSIRTLIVGCCLLLSAVGAQAATVDLGDMGPPGVRFFGNSFWKTGSNINSDYSFQLGGKSDIVGDIVGLDLPLNILDIGVASVSLFKGDGTTLVGSDASPLHFSFDDLAAGDYILRLVINVTK